MLVEEVDSTLVDTLGDGLADLMRTSPVDHIKASPSVLGLGAGRGANEEGVLELSLEVVLLDIVGHVGRSLPIARTDSQLTITFAILNSSTGHPPAEEAGYLDPRLRDQRSSVRG